MSDTKASRNRRAVNLTLDAEVVEEARALGVNLSKAADEGVARAIGRIKARQWAEENADVIRSTNEYIEKHGLPLAKYRMF